MKYYVTLHHYESGSGYSHSEQFDKGTCDEFFTAADYVKASGTETETETGWTEVEVTFYADDGDPMFDDPIRKSAYNQTTTGKL